MARGRTERRRLPDAPMGEFSGLFHREPFGCALLLPLLGALLPSALAFLACSKITQSSVICRPLLMPAEGLEVSLMQIWGQLRSAQHLLVLVDICMSPC